jgi:hypothetical protein
LSVGDLHGFIFACQAGIGEWGLSGTAGDICHWLV